VPHDVIMPALGMAQDSGLLVAWLKRPGDRVVKGEALFEVETDKATMEVEAQSDGYLSDVGARAGEDVPVGRVIARIVSSEPEVTEAAPAAPVAMPGGEAGTVALAGLAAQPASHTAGSAPIAPMTGRILASPKARRLAAERGLDLGRLAEAGHPQPFHVADLGVLAAMDAGQRADFIASPSIRQLAANLGVDLGTVAARTGRTSLAREDVLAARAGHPAAPAKAPAVPSPWDVDHAAWGPVREEKLARFTLVSAANLALAHSTIPSVTHHDSADMRRVEAIRAMFKAKGRKLTALAFHVAALACCLREFPRFNASLAPGGESLFLKDYVHIGIAVDTPYGLVVPVIRNADGKTVVAIGEAIATLAARAQERKLRPEDMGGASMTVSSLGAIGGESFTPIINPPELAILGLSRSEIRPVWDGAAFQPVPMVPLDLTYDHRVVNGADAARFLTRYRALLADADGLDVAPG
jgi:pyruvate dehydrogenase E2 component (dihydrolipoamide acetyltransferase)